jgi:peptide/nickel transport system substrate-binding protein
LLLTLTVAVMSACTSATPEGAPPERTAPRSATSGSARTLVAAVRAELQSVSQRPLREGATSSQYSKRLFNAELTLLDERGLARPYLAEALPRLNSDSWQLFPDGRMETTWRLRAGAVWHNGAPLTARDFVFAWRVYSTPDFGGSAAPLYQSIEEVLAPDERTVVMRWARPYPDAARLSSDRGGNLPPLPEEILGPSFPQLDADAFTNHPYWTREYVGLGPYRLERWEPGAFLEVTAFDRHVLGPPKVDRIKLVFIGDSTAVLASMLAGEVHLAVDNSLRLEHAFTLKRDWAERGVGAVLLQPGNWRATLFQLRTDLANPRSILDPRVRKVLAHGVDRQAIDDILYQGAGVFADFAIPAVSEWGTAVEGAIVRYPYDLRRSETLMQEVGFTRAADGIFGSAGEERFRAELKTNAAADNEAELAIMASEWRKAGFDIQDAVLPAALAQDPHVRAAFPAMFTFGTPAGEAALSGFATAAIARPETGWRGANRGGWSNPEYDRLLDSFATTLESDDRARQVARMARLITEELPAISLFFRSQPWAHVAGLRGMMIVAPETTAAWNVHEWELR